MMIMRTALAFVVLLVLNAPVTHAGNGTIGPPLVVPVSNCPPVCIPEDTNPCCVPIKMTCTIQNSPPEITGAGSLDATTITQDYECAQCFSCCPCCPVRLGEGYTRGDCCDCAELPDKVCTFSISLSITESVQVSLSSTLESSVGVDANFIRAQLEAIHGATDGQTVSFQADCEVVASPCVKYSDSAYIEYYPNKEVSMSHTWIIQGVWATAPGCSTAPCPIDGMPFETPNGCHTETSTASGSKYANQSCGDDAMIEQCGG